MKAMLTPSGLLVAVVLTLIVILAMGLTTGEKKIEQSVERLYAADDPAFARAMGVLLDWLGNKVTPSHLATMEEA